MSDNKRYYYIKLKENYFDQDNIKILEAQENGYIYSLIILKLYLKSARYDGRLMMTDRIPYDPENVETLAKVIGHDVAHVKDALQYAVKLDLITIQTSGEIWMTDIQNFIGRSSTEADRIRKYRKKIELVQMYDKSTPELETEKEIDIEIDNPPPDSSLRSESSPQGEPSPVRKKKKTPNNKGVIEEIYQAYPRHVGKGAAIKAITKAVKKVDPSFLLEKVKQYASSVEGKDKKYIPYPATWFNQERWDDDPSEWEGDRSFILQEQDYGLLEKIFGKPFLDRHLKNFYPTGATYQENLKGLRDYFERMRDIEIQRLPKDEQLACCIPY